MCFTSCDKKRNEKREKLYANSSDYKINFKFALVSTELPEAIQDCVDFNIASIAEEERIKSLFELKDKFSSDEAFKIFLEFAGYNIKLTREDDEEKSETKWDIESSQHPQVPRWYNFFKDSGIKNIAYYQHCINKYFEDDQIISNTLVLVDNFEDNFNSFGVYTAYNPGHILVIIHC